MKVEKRQAKKDGKGKKRNFKSHESNFEWEQLTHMSSIWWNQNAPKINKTCRIHRMHLFWNGSIYSNPWNDGLRQRLTTHMLVFATSHHLKYNFFFVHAQFISLRQRCSVCGVHEHGVKIQMSIWKWAHCGWANKDRKIKRSVKWKLFLEY